MSDRRPTILVVDDHPDLRDALVVLLEHEAYRVADASNGAEALEYIRGAIVQRGIGRIVAPDRKAANVNARDGSATQRDHVWADDLLGQRTDLAPIGSRSDFVLFGPLSR